MHHAQIKGIAGRSAEPVIALDGSVSEWLFVLGFWSRINKSLGTMFDQFEEDEVEPAFLSQIASELGSCVRPLQTQRGEEMRFVCGWSPAGEPHTVEVHRADLVSQLTMLQRFLTTAATNGNVLEFLSSAFDCSALLTRAPHGQHETFDGDDQIGSNRWHMGAADL